MLSVASNAGSDARLNEHVCVNKPADESANTSKRASAARVALAFF